MQSYYIRRQKEFVLFVGVDFPRCVLPRRGQWTRPAVPLVWSGGPAAVAGPPSQVLAGAKLALIGGEARASQRGRRICLPNR